MAVLDRRNAYSAIPQLEGKLSKLTNYITIENGKVKISAKDLYLKGSELTVSLEEVGLSYVDKDEIIAQINASEEGVLISADKVNIAGAAIFSEYAKKEEAVDGVQYIYYSRASNSTPTKPSTWVTDATGNNNTWTTKRPQYSTSYKYLFVAKQEQTVDGEIETSTPTRDETTTVIDGGNIITGTVTANQLSVGVQNDIDDAANTANSFLTTISGTTGICVHDSNDTSNYVNITSGSVGIYVSGSHKASFISTGLEFYNGGSRIANLSRNAYNEMNFDLNGNGSCYVGAYSGNVQIGANYSILLNNSTSVSGSLSVSSSISGGAISGSSLSISGDATVNKLYINTPGTASSSTANTRIATGESNRVMFTGSSSRKVKHDIKPIEDDILDPHRLYDAEVVQFVYNLDYLNKKDNRYGMAIPGFIADDLQKVYPIAVDIENGEPQDWNFRYVLPPMLALIQEQHKEIEELKRRIECLNESRK